ncbi:6-phospho-beta-glucosidase [Dongshaea marina]|uniref:6-phospho-beta-glucosidase n=1 Tax=Dongshaea marina TaxID=2047966 RepID=UPI002D772137|nr:6-phospho-beta-glucosidase [Dongshaea marina]
MSGLKIAIIGAGSSYTPELIEGFIERACELPLRELALVDIEAGREKLEIITALTRRMLEKAGLDIRVTAGLDRKEALKDADFVCSQFRVGCLDARISDERISLKYQVIGQETNGLGGFSKAIRTIPVAIEIAREMELLCPDAWLINFTNPSGMVTEALLQHTNIKVVGLCNVPVIMERGLTEMLALDPERCCMQFAGLNHFVYLRELYEGAEDRMPQVLAAALEGDERLVPRNISPFRWPEALIRGIGMLPCPYLRYYYLTDSIMAEELAEAAGEGTRGEVVKKLEAALFERYRDPELNEKPKELEGRGGQYYSQAACELISSIYNDKRTIMHVNTRNDGSIAGLPDDAAVEVSSLITRSGPKPLNVKPFDPDTLVLLQLMKRFESLTVESAISGCRDTAIKALTLNPW